MNVLSSVRRRRSDGPDSLLPQTSGMASQNSSSGVGANRSTQRPGPAHLAIFVALACAALAGCQRRLPGPDECHDFALVWVLGPRAPLVRRISPGTQDAILERTTECLTTPYDRELVQCVTGGGGRQACLASFSRRHRLPTPPEQ